MSSPSPIHQQTGRPDFLPDRYLWIIIKNKRYDILRNKGGVWKNYKDIPYVDDDAINVKNGVKELGAEITDILTYEDVSYQELTGIKNKLRQEIVKNWAEKRKTLCFVYYAGHGVMDTMTYAVCNSADKKFLYPLQGQLKALSQETGAYIIGIFACCREKIP